ncbi:hypothetical protein [Streptomyces sp. HD]|uniref:hypothetical protein n=1 Tax=Streptomyces sp. HD TaxID=3020892 RepID=UPI00232BA4C7|nr:hypothetical protein [Streptomyces sp. HD]MDC0772485.1 hypothetical protein [Streptomyces sp. HD]
MLDTITAHARTLWDGLGLRGSARIDFILTEDNEPYVLEVNTTPACPAPATSRWERRWSDSRTRTSYWPCSTRLWPARHTMSPFPLPRSPAPHGLGRLPSRRRSPPLCSASTMSPCADSSSTPPSGIYTEPGSRRQDRMVQPGVRPGLAENDPARLRARSTHGHGTPETRGQE